MTTHDFPELLNKPEAGAIPDVLPLFLPRDLVIYPGLIFPLAVSDDETVSLIDDVMSKGQRILGSFLMKPDARDGDLSAIHTLGTALIIHRMMRVGDGTIRMIVQGLARISLEEIVEREPHPKARVKVLTAKARKTVKFEALIRALREDFEKIAELSEQVPEEFKLAVDNLDDPGSLVDLIASNLTVESQVRQQILATINIPDRIRLLRRLLARELQILQVGSQIQNATRGEIEKGQREYYLRQQLKQIQKELGEDEDSNPEVNEWRVKIEKAELPERVLEVADKELERLERMNPASAEYSVVTTYLDWLVTIPWEYESVDHLDLNHALKILDEDHHGLSDIKDRILEVLAVRKLKPQAQGPILCFVGPPGVGKTSLGQSVARAMGREFVRMSLGGVRDEAEIRGHRRTYVGAMPGRIIQQIKRAGTRNPVFMLDEIDKLVSDFRGDPSSALLEVLDPAQNHTFSDHYLDIDFDLSSVFFITTANYLEAIPAPLRDRMEVIRLSGYISDEKVKIAERYLVPRQIEANGLLKKHVRFHKAALEDIITYHTREAGVRNLERTIDTVVRKVARKIAAGKAKGTTVVSRENLKDFLGPQKITPSWVNRKSTVGVTTGLAYTPFGGDVLRIETATMPGKGGLRITGQLGDVMKESAQIAMSWVRGHQNELGIRADKLTKNDLHIHVPEGATPKDGPSAGVTLVTSLASLLSGKKVRADLAMTGEVTLTGYVLPIGGLREKVVAANRARIRHIVLPWDNQKDLEKVPEDVRKRIEFHPVKTVEEVLALAFVGGYKPVGGNGKLVKPAGERSNKGS